MREGFFVRQHPSPGRRGGRGLGGLADVREEAAGLRIRRRVLARRAAVVRVEEGREARDAPSSDLVSFDGELRGPAADIPS